MKLLIPTVNIRLTNCLEGNNKLLEIRELFKYSGRATSRGVAGSIVLSNRVENELKLSSNSA